MELIKLSIPAGFISSKTRLTWREVFFGIENELLASGAAVDFAAEELARQNSASATLVELASLAAGESTRELVQQLAGAEPEDEPNEVREKWLYLVLAWLFDHRDAYADPLQTVEEVYADFEYPPAIAGFVRYMPMDEPDRGSRALNEARLYNKWKQYLEETATRYRSEVGSAPL